ncbi:unnamed protein product [Natator depressus]
MSPGYGTDFLLTCVVKCGLKQVFSDLFFFAFYLFKVITAKRRAPGSLHRRCLIRDFGFRLLFPHTLPHPLHMEQNKVKKHHFQRIKTWMEPMFSCESATAVNLWKT